MRDLLEIGLETFDLFSLCLVKVCAQVNATRTLAYFESSLQKRKNLLGSLYPPRLLSLGWWEGRLGLPWLML